MELKYLKYKWSKIGAFKVYISRKTNGKTFVIDLTRTQFTVGGPFYCYAMPR